MMSKVLQALEHSEQHHQTFKMFDSGQAAIDTSKTRTIPSWLLATLIGAPALASGVLGIYQNYADQLAVWQTSNQPKSQVQHVPFQYQTLVYPSFGALRESSALLPLLSASPQLSEQTPRSNLASSSQEEKVATSTENDTLLEDLDLSGLPPELALRVESALENRDDFNQSNSSDLALNAREWQGKLPPLNFQTHVYSSNPNKRWVKVNGTEYREGEWINDNIQLQHIDSQHSIISFNGNEIQVPALYDWQG